MFLYALKRKVVILTNFRYWLNRAYLHGVLQWSQWRKSRHHDDLSVSVYDAEKQRNMCMNKNVYCRCRELEKCFLLHNLTQANVTPHMAKITPTLGKLWPLHFLTKKTMTNKAYRERQHPQPLDQWTNSPFISQQVGNCKSFTLTHYLVDLFAMHVAQGQSHCESNIIYNSHPFHSKWVDTPIPKLQQFQYFTIKIQGQGHGWGQSLKSQCESSILSTNIPFVPCQSAIPFLRYDFFKIWPWKSKVKVMEEVNIESHNMGPTFYRLTSLSFHVNRPSHSYDKTFSKFDHENPRSRSWVRRKLKVTTWVQHSIDSHPFHSMSIGHPIPERRHFQNLTMKIQGQGHGWGESWKSQHGSNIQSTHIPLIPCQSAIPFLRGDFFKIWPWKSKVKVMVGVKVECHKVGATSYRLTFLSFHVNRPSHSRDTAFSKFYLENPRSRSWLTWTLKVTAWVQHSIDSHPFTSMSIGHPIPEIRLFQNLTLKNPRSRSWLKSKLKVTKWV